MLEGKITVVAKRPKNSKPSYEISQNDENIH